MDLGLQFLKFIYQQLIDATSILEEAALLFRTDSLCSKMLKEFGKSVGRPFLRTAMADLIDHVLHTEESFEVDPARLTPKDNLQANRNNLYNVCQAFLDSISRAQPVFPLYV